MTKNPERKARIAQALREANLAAVACALPAQVLLLSGYWPVLGTALAIATHEGQVFLLAPEDERELAHRGWADTVETFHPGSLETLSSVPSAISSPLKQLARAIGVTQGCLGFESGSMFEPASYAGMHFYNSDLERLLREAFPTASFAPADTLLMSLRAVKTAYELERIRDACRIAERAFVYGAARLQPGLSETAAASLFRAPLSVVEDGDGKLARADGFTFCMSGVYSAEAHRAYARSRCAKKLGANEFALIHCNSYADGYWTDITRTYCLGEADPRQEDLYLAVCEARLAALAVIAPGVRAAEVDRAARAVLTARGFGADFKHATGHEVGFAAISHNAPPRLHPQSTDVLETGMVFNVEPAIYIDDYGGFRHCDMVAVTEHGAEVLTSFQTELAQLVLADFFSQADGVGVSSAVSFQNVSSRVA